MSQTHRLFRIRRYHANQRLLMVTIPTARHEALHLELWVDILVNIATELLGIIKRTVGDSLVAPPSDREVTLEETVEKAIQLVVQSQHVVVVTPGQHW